MGMRYEKRKNSKEKLEFDILTLVSFRSTVFGNVTPYSRRNVLKDIQGDSGGVTATYGAHF
jgi:hypothetical protein